MISSDGLILIQNPIDENEDSVTSSLNREYLDVPRVNFPLAHSVTLKAELTPWSECRVFQRRGGFGRKVNRLLDTSQSDLSGRTMSAEVHAPSELCEAGSYGNNMK